MNNCPFSRKQLNQIADKILALFRTTTKQDLNKKQESALKNRIIEIIKNIGRNEPPGGTNPSPKTKMVMEGSNMDLKTTVSVLESVNTIDIPGSIRRRLIDILIKLLERDYWRERTRSRNNPASAAAAAVAEARWKAAMALAAAESANSVAISTRRKFSAKSPLEQVLEIRGVRLLLPNSPTVTVKTLQLSAKEITQKDILPKQKEKQIRQKVKQQIVKK